MALKQKRKMERKKKNYKKKKILKNANQQKCEI